MEAVQHLLIAMFFQPLRLILAAVGENHPPRPGAAFLVFLGFLILTTSFGLSPSRALVQVDWVVVL